MTKALPTQAEIDAGPHGGIGTIPTDYIPNVPLVGTLSVLPDHVKSCVVAYGNARVAVALKHLGAPGAAIDAREQGCGGAVAVERSEFEKHIVGEGYNAEHWLQRWRAGSKENTDRYMKDWVQTAWEAWKKRAGIADQEGGAA